ncbi:MAG: amidophosphoribosyltransferase, partial [Rhodospirillaceae bacterium]|nr:amidophosphoribosyltransferase [Rhodospirillaceae bacterium]
MDDRRQIGTLSRRRCGLPAEPGARRPADGRRFGGGGAGARPARPHRSTRARRRNAGRHFRRSRPRRHQPIDRKHRRAGVKPTVKTSYASASNHPSAGDDDKFHDECGVFGIYGHPEAAAMTALGLHALQHRGQEASGIVTHCEGLFHAHRGLGQVGDNFSAQDVIQRLRGQSAIGHNRYATTGETAIRNVQPLFADLEFGGFGIAHNGNLANSYQLRRQLIRQGSIFQTTTDTEVIVHLMAHSRGATTLDRMVDALRQVEGAYSLVAITEQGVIGFRDPLGVRPLVLGRVSDAYVLTSETVALDIIGGEAIRDVAPGEMVILDNSGVTSFHPIPAQKQRFCIFEYIYFARPDSRIEGRSVYDARRLIGRELAREAGVDADMVVPVPDSGVPSAIGYAAESKLPFELGIVRNHYVGRTFIEPTDQIRHLGVKLKHNANASLLAGRRVILVDDSIVRGTTSKKIVEMVRLAG